MIPNSISTGGKIFFVGMSILYKIVNFVIFTKNSIYLKIRFYVCAVSDDPCERGNTTVTISADEARQDAQIIGYVLLMTGSGFILLCEHFYISCP